MRKESLMPPIPSARSSPSSRKTSTPRGPDGRHPDSPMDLEYDQNNFGSGLKIVGETGYLPLNSRKKSTAEKLSDTGFFLYTMEDSNKLPQILKPTRKVSKGSKRKKSTAVDQNSYSGREDDMKTRLQAIEENKGNSGDVEGELYNKYGLDLKRHFSKLLPSAENASDRRSTTKRAYCGLPVGIMNLE